jgi:hypothetical protein
VFGRVLRKISGPNRDEVTVKGLRIDNEELHYLYYSPNIIRVKSEIGGASGTHGEEERYLKRSGGEN